MYTLWSNVLCLEPHMPPQPIRHPHLFPLHPPPHMGPYGLVTISPFRCGGYSLGLQWLLSSLVETRFLLQETDQSSLLLREAFLTSLFTLLSTFLCTNFYCSTYHYVVKISVCFCTGLWTREEVLVKNRKRNNTCKHLFSTYYASGTCISSVKPTVTLWVRCNFYSHFIDEGTEA